jgi:uncharacterized membrane protein YqjE
MRALLGDAMILALFVLLTVNFALLWVWNGEYRLYEHNMSVLIFETVMTAGIGVLGLERLIHHLRKSRLP